MGFWGLRFSLGFIGFRVVAQRKDIWGLSVACYSY